MSDENPNPSQYPLDEPSVLDYVKSLFRSGDGKRIQIPVEEKVVVEERKSLTLETPVLQPIDDIQVEPSFLEAPSTELEPVAERVEARVYTPFPWRSLLAFGLAWIGQRLFEPPSIIELGIVFYVAAFSSLGWAIYRREWTLPSLAPTSERTDPLTYRGLPLVLSVGLAFLSFLLFGDYIFTQLNVTVWILAIVFLIWAFWLNTSSLRSNFGRLTSFFQREVWTITISRWTLLLIAETALVFFFRFYQTASVPPEPFSDQAEKILDVYDVSQGQTKVFFTRNTGREGFQMYWTLLVARIFGTGL